MENVPHEDETLVIFTPNLKKAPYKPLVLTIDDEPIIRKSIAAYFKDSGFRVIEAADGEEGLRYVRSEKPDIVITDLRMPNMDGMQVVTAIHELDDNLPVIVLSGMGDLSDAIETLRKGASDYLTKPLYDIAELEIVVNRCLERKRLVRENRNYSHNLELLVNNRTVELRKLFKAVEQSANSVMITDTNGSIEYVNPKFSETTGYSFAEAIGAKSSLMKSGKMPEELYTSLWTTILGGNEWRGEFLNKRKNGELYWEQCSVAPIRDDHGEITHFVGIKEDVTERKKYEETLYQKANFDSLTGLPNREYLQSFLEQQFSELQLGTTFLHLMLLDLDRLKFFNDTFGHSFTDQLLIEVAKRLQLFCEDRFLAARFMGNEFVIVPANTRQITENPITDAETVRSIINSPILIDGTEIQLTVGIGVVSYPEDGECPTTLLKNAEAALHQARKIGRNRIQHYNRELGGLLMEQFEMEQRLAKALERGEFTLDYQPQVHLPDGSITGAEALLRWTPQGGKPVAPTLFIPLLEEIGQIVEVGDWVLQQACSQAVQWQRAGLPPIRVSVNFSALQFMHSDIVRMVRTVLEKTGLEPALLCLELTESMLMTECESTLHIMNELRATGALLSLDDFGTGYSSLSYLGRMPINELKIDQSFTRRMLTTANDAAVVNAIIAMAQGLELELVAEGVETAEQLGYLRDRNCMVIQGYYFSKPLPADQFELFVQGCGANILKSDV